MTNNNTTDILFIQQFISIYSGVNSISSYLKHKGFNSDVLIEAYEKNLIEQIRKIKPGIIGISLTSLEHKWLKKLIFQLKENFPHIKIIVGGIHAILYYEEILNETPADLVCHSEGEQVTFELLNELKEPTPDFNKIKGLAFKGADGKIVMTERANLNQYNDEILETNEVYLNRYNNREFYSMYEQFITSRGCPYRCSFCYNANIHDVFKGKGKYLRQKSVENIIKEIEYTLNKIPLQSLNFVDDLFSFDKVWLQEFATLYKERINLPIICSIRANTFDEQTAKILKECNCIGAGFGIESGNYEIRKNILKKHITNEQIINTGLLLKKYKINSLSTNIFCLPDETKENALETIEINHKAKIKDARATLLLPFPNTALADYCIKQGYVKPDYSILDVPSSTDVWAVLDIPDRKYITNIFYLTYFMVKLPMLYPVFKRLCNLNFLVPLYKLIFRSSYFFALISFYKMSFFRVFKNHLLIWKVKLENRIRK